MPERYELRPVSELRAGDLIYMMTRRLEVTADPYQGDLGPGFRRVPVRRVDNYEDVMAPPFELDHLVPVLIDEDKAGQYGLASRLRVKTSEADAWRKRAEEAEASRDRLIKAARKMTAGLRELGVIPS